MQNHIKKCRQSSLVSEKQGLLSKTFDELQFQECLRKGVRDAFMLFRFLDIEI